MQKNIIKELYEYKLDLLYYGVVIDNDCIKTLRKGINNQISHNDYITTKGLMIRLNSSVYVNANINEESPYIIEISHRQYILKYHNNFICNVTIFQPPDYALQNTKLSNNELISDYANLHGDRIRLQPIEGCANMCKFCDLNRKKYKQHSIKYLDEAFQYVLKNNGFRHVLISGGSPRNRDEDYNYLNNVYEFFGKKYGKIFPIDIMLVPRGLNVTSNNPKGYEEFLKKLKEWNISGLSVNLELYNDYFRKKYIPKKDYIRKENYINFIKLALEIFGKNNVRSCIIIGLESINDSLKAVEELCKIGCMPVLSPYIPNDTETSLPKPEVMKEVLLKSKEIADKYNIELGPLCASCKHNTIHFN